MPSNVARFEALMYLSVALGIVSSASEWATLLSKAQVAGVRLVLLVALSFLLLRIALIWLTARKRQGWARWALLILVLVVLPQFFKSLGPLLNQNPVAWALRLAQFALDVVAFVLIFTGDSREWFNPTSDPMAKMKSGSPI
jgi:hypothetical protein